jgi:hypothetical protein
MNLIAFVSIIAVIVGLAGTVPQIICMLRSRSSAGQSSTGWMMGVGVNAMMGYVNAVGYGAAVLALGNTLGLILNLVALSLVQRYRTVQAARPQLDELHTSEFFALHDAVLSEHSRRTATPAEPELVAA